MKAQGMETTLSTFIAHKQWFPTDSLNAFEMMQKDFQSLNIHAPSPEPQHLAANPVRFPCSPKGTRHNPINVDKP
jgi:hypothetical protein